MMNYIVAILVFVLLCAGWAVFQLWLGNQADGTPLDSDTRSCHGCGGAAKDNVDGTPH